MASKYKNGRRGAFGGFGIALLLLAGCAGSDLEVSSRTAISEMDYASAAAKMQQLKQECLSQGVPPAQANVCAERNAQIYDQQIAAARGRWAADMENMRRQGEIEAIRNSAPPPAAPVTVQQYAPVTPPTPAAGFSCISLPGGFVSCK